MLFRSRETILEYLNRGNRTAKHGTEEFVGDDFLLKQGVTLVWLGWQQDLPEGLNLLRMSGPVIESLSSLVYGDAVVTAKSSEISLGDRLSIPYAVSDMKSPQAWLSVAASRTAPEQLVPRDQWSFARMRDGTLTDSPLHIHLKGGFEPGAYYRFAYPVKGSLIAGLSLTGIRDLMSWIRYDPAAIVKGKHTLAFGISQSGRFLRDFVYQGFNQDERARKVLDGALAHTAGVGGVFLNAEFGQPARTNTQFEDHLMPENAFPFSTARMTDPVTGKTDGLMRSDGFDPL